MKVFCEGCIFFIKGERIPFPFGDPKCFDIRHFNIDPEMIACEKKEQCLSPNNFKDTHEKEKKEVVSIPSIINRFNDCKWFSDIPPDPPSSSSSSSEEPSSSSSSY